MDAIGALIPKLGELLKQEYDLQTSVKGGIMILMAELESIQAALETVSGVPAEQLDKNARIWARDIREMSYDIEDTVDTFLVRVEGTKPAKMHNIEGFIGRTLNLLSKARISANKLSKVKIRRKIAIDIKDIMHRVKEVKERQTRYQVGSGVVANPTTESFDHRRAEAFFKNVTELVAIDDTMGELINMLNIGGDMSKKNLKSVSVVGVGGLGKTTLAKAVYDKLKADFECCAFVSVGQNPVVKKVLMDILYELDKQEYVNIHKFKGDEMQLINLILEFLGNKRYFIVIDDIWDIKLWEAIKLALVENTNGSRIVTTTRKTDVAEAVGARKAGDVYKLKPLPDGKSEKLFYKRIFGGEGKCPDNLPNDDLPDKILKKCGGIPLAIITIASLLAGKPREQWFEVYRTISFSHKDNPHVENTMKVLAYSYNDMPFHLRTCLLYLSVFPEDHVIDKGSLIWMWIAEGFIHREEGVGLFELGERYFNELVNRSMIQPVVQNEVSGIVDGCCLHDMVLGLICCLSREENFVTIIDDEQDTLAQSQFRRFSFQRRTVGQMVMPHMRSFVAFQCTAEMAPLASFRVLRVLALEDCPNVTDCHMKHLGELLHLRYLRLKDIDICELPKEIGALKFLQTLDFSRCYYLKLPSSVSLLAQLVCLRAKYMAQLVMASQTIGTLTSLEELWIGVPSCDSESESEKLFTELGNLRELRVLKLLIWRRDLRESEEKALLESLRNLIKLRHLQIGPRGMASRGWEAPDFVLSRHLRFLQLPSIEFPSLPTWINSSRLPSLSTLSLKVQYLCCRDMRILGRLPELCSLELSTDSNLVVCVGNGYFRKLRYFSLRAGGIMFRRDESGAPVMSSLESLRLVVHVRGSVDTYFRQGQGISFFVSTVIALHNIPSLQKVSVALSCGDSTRSEVEEMEAALRHAAAAHPNHPTLQILRISERYMITQHEMDNRKSLGFCVKVPAFRDIGFCFNFTNWPSLEKVHAYIYCEYATRWEVLEAKAALRHAVDIHPNHPVLKMELFNDEDEDNEDDDDEEVSSMVTMTKQLADDEDEDEEEEKEKEEVSPSD